MKRKMLVGVAALIVAFAVSCEDGTWQQGKGLENDRVPQAVLPPVPEVYRGVLVEVDEAAVQKLVAWAESHPLPRVERNCGSMQGPSLCWDAYAGVMFCRSVCGQGYWQLSTGCIDAMTGETFVCP